MTVLISIVSFLGVIIVLVMGHELGHFVTAKLSGIKVEEFGLFYPPRLFSIVKRGTRYSINALPLGGFVKMAGEEDPDVSGSLASKGYGTRLLVLSAGSIMNFLLPVLLFAIAFMLPHNVATNQSKIYQVSPNSPAQAAGIVPGDIILAVNGHTVSSVEDVSRYLTMAAGNQTSMLLSHNGTQETVSLIPRLNPPPGQGAVGIEIGPVVAKKSEPFWVAIPKGVTSSIQTFNLFKTGIIKMIAGSTPVELAGPVGIAQMTGEVARAGISPLLEFAAFLSINLAIINIFPLPALDGGRIAFVLIEWIRRGKRISPSAEGKVHLIGFALLMAFFIAVTYQDILRIIAGKTLMP